MKASSCFYFASRITVLPDKYPLIQEGLLMYLLLSEMFSKFAELTPATIAILCLLIIVGVGGAVFLRKSRETRFTTRMLVYASVSIALAFVLSYIRLARMPQGGSITPGCFRLLFAYIFDPFRVS